MATPRLLRSAVVVCTLGAAAPAACGAVLDFTAGERAAILAHGPWPPPVRTDSSNRASGNPAAAALGRKLFFDARLARDEAGSCASCHQPERRFTDGLATARGAGPLRRNTPSLLNVSLQRWFGWDGGHDSLWAQSLRPIVSPLEMNSSLLDTANLVAGDAGYRELFERAYALSFHALDAEAVFVLAGKALAAYQETLRSGRTAFDAFRDALAAGDQHLASAYPLAAQRGLRVFIGAGRCSVCHAGPRFSHGQFGNVGIAGPGAADTGRYQGVQDLLASRYNLLGPYNDQASRINAAPTRDLRLQLRHRGEFRVPSLRGVADTTPYMHDGTLATLRDVVDHYARLDLEELSASARPALEPLHFGDGQIDDLLAFLHSLSTDE